MSEKRLAELNEELVMLRLDSRIAEQSLRKQILIEEVCQMKSIKTEAEYYNALLRIESLWDATAGTPEEKELDRLASMVETYEKEHYPIGGQTNEQT